MIEYLSGEFNRGYTRAILDLIEVFRYCNDDLKHRRKQMNYKVASALLKCCLENRAELRESEMTGDNVRFIRWNTEKNGWEFYDGRR